MNSKKSFTFPFIKSQQIFTMILSKMRVLGQKTRVGGPPASLRGIGKLTMTYILV